MTASILTYVIWKRTSTGFDFNTFKCCFIFSIECIVVLEVTYDTFGSIICHVWKV